MAKTSRRVHKNSFGALIIWEEFILSKKANPTSTKAMKATDDIE